MPYIITTATPWGVNLGTRDKYAVTSRRAVATLDEAQTAIRPTIYAALTPQGHPAGPSEHWRTFNRLPESGGTIGPLPDGTIIEVSPFKTDVPEWRARELIDAYNAAQS